MKRNLQYVAEMRRESRTRAARPGVPMLGEDLLTKTEQIAKHETLRLALGASLLTLVQAPATENVSPPLEVPMHGFYRGTWHVRIPEWGQLEIGTKHKERADEPRIVISDGYIGIAGQTETDELSPAERHLISVLDFQAFEYGLPDVTSPEQTLVADLRRMEDSLQVVQSMCTTAGATLSLPANVNL